MFKVDNTRLPFISCEYFLSWQQQNEYVRKAACACDNKCSAYHRFWTKKAWYADPGEQSGRQHYDARSSTIKGFQDILFLTEKLIHRGKVVTTQNALNVFQLSPFQFLGI